MSSSGAPANSHAAHDADRSPGPYEQSSGADQSHGRDQGSGSQQSDADHHADAQAQQPVGWNAAGRRGSGGTPDSGGVGRPGGVQPLGAGRSKTRDPSKAVSPATGGMGASKHGGSEDGDEEEPPAVTFGDARSYERAPDGEHRFGALSYAGGSSGSALDSADALDSAAEDEDAHRERADGGSADQPPVGGSAG